MQIAGKTLDENQIEIVKEKNSFIAIAGAGSGKTLTIVAKVKYMIDSGRSPDEILIIAYTRLSSKEIEERLAKIGIKLKVYTFHSLAYKSCLIKKLIKEEEVKSFNDAFFKDNVAIKKDFELLLSQSDNKSIARNLLIKDLISLATVITVNNYSIDNFKSFNRYDNATKRIVLRYLKEYEEYKKKLQVIDYDDMIKNAVGKVSKKYKYVIVDEFQDISLIRFNLLKSIIDQNEAKLYTFGDDYQAIYGFSGSKLAYFVDFEKYSGIKNQMFITKTYRNSNELLDIATSFVLKNKKQIKKQLSSNKHLKDVMEIIYYDYDQAFKYIFSKLDKTSSVLILSRYGFNEKILKENGFKYHNGYYTYQDFTNIKFLTVHKAKGLEADNVIILEMINDTYGFPTKLKTSHFLRKINDYKEMKYAEERRLFYVAITRTKNRVYLISDKENESLFIKEIKKYKGVKLVK